MNRGGKAQDQTDPAEKTRQSAWAPYFSSPRNRYFYQTRLLRWFELWQHPLNPDTPTELDRALSQTNLFLDQSPSFSDIQRRETAWKEALERLAAAIQELDASGILFVSKGVVDQGFRFAERHEPEGWKEAIGADVHWGEPGV